MSGRPALVVATVLTGDDGDYRLEVRDDEGCTVGAPLVVVDVAIRPGDEGLNITPEGLRWRSLNEGARSLGVTIAGWHTMTLERHGATYVANVLAPYPLPPITCQPWCVQGDGHTDALFPDDQRCEAQGVEVDGHLVYLERRPGEPVRLHVDHEERTVISVAPYVARVIAAAIREMCGDGR